MNKEEQLKEYLKELGSLCIAYSAGVDSTYLLHIAREVLGDKALAVTIDSDSYTRREYTEAERFCKEIGVKHIICRVNQFSIEGFRTNPVDRCYHCKKVIFQTIQGLAKENGIQYVADGSNTDDDGDYRPGHKAIQELGVISPLRAVGMNKADIRAFSKERNLPTWDKPSFACLASRFPYGDEITAEKLRRLEAAENYILKEGYSQVRVRIHGDLARIEVCPKEMTKAFQERDAITKTLKGLGFSYVTLDLQGYRTGSMNETIEM